jgi:hypothetical protein
MKKKKDPYDLPNWNGNKPNYELEYLRLENQKLKEQVEYLNRNKKYDPHMEKDIAVLLDVSMRMKYLLEQCRSQTMLPIDLGRQIDRVIKEIENYG